MRVAVLSDIHANVAALEAVLAVIPSVDEVWQLGDVVGYGPEPDAVVARLREVGARGVRGNHDAAAVGRLDIESFNADARQAMEWTQATIAADTREWLEALPERLEREDFLLVHGSPRDPTWEYVYHDAGRPGRHRRHADDAPASTATRTCRSRTSRTTGASRR